MKSYLRSLAREAVRKGMSRSSFVRGMKAEHLPDAHDAFDKALRWAEIQLNPERERRE